MCGIGDISHFILLKTYFILYFSNITLFKCLFHITYHVHVNSNNLNTFMLYLLCVYISSVQHICIYILIFLVTVVNLQLLTFLIYFCKYFFYIEIHYDKCITCWIPMKICLNQYWDQEHSNARK